MNTNRKMVVYNFITMVGTEHEGPEEYHLHPECVEPARLLIESMKLGDGPHEVEAQPGVFCDYCDDEVVLSVV